MNIKTSNLLVTLLYEFNIEGHCEKYFIKNNILKNVFADYRK